MGAGVSKQMDSRARGSKGPSRRLMLQCQPLPPSHSPEVVAVSPWAAVRPAASAAAALLRRPFAAVAAAAWLLLVQFSHQRLQVNPSTEVAPGAAHNHTAGACRLQPVESRTQLAPHGSVDGVAFGWAIEHQSAHTILFHGHRDALKAGCLHAAAQSGWGVRQQGRQRRDTAVGGSR